MFDATYHGQGFPRQRGQEWDDGTYFGGKKSENLKSEKRPRDMCKGVALLVVTLRARYRRILLFSPSPISSHLPQCVGDASLDPFFVVVFSHPGKWHAILGSRFVPKLGQ